ncbi:DUF732 domain-containing protein [Mycobacterium bohemicum]|uniref:DUF732 domain-containing protein n=1 Tax=Mycobacterium bohemicum TaxID=56425 RepID=UPI000A167AAA|nr:DUF732 domain-containing protein [Mycobacterium bohemicum]MCV6968982.1 DUF732 domain-containing protein [Mycobacterium bohemicum]
MDIEDDRPDETAAGCAPSDETIVVPDIPATEAPKLAWSVGDDSPTLKIRRPLPRSLQILLAVVAVGIVAVSAFIAGAQYFTGRTPVESKRPAATPPSPVSVSVSTRPNGYIDDQDRVFLSTLSRDDWFSSVPRDELIDSAHIYCTKANQGQQSKAEAANRLLKLGMSLEHATNFMYAATVAYCPNQLSGVQ